MQLRLIYEIRTIDFSKRRIIFFILISLQDDK